MSDMFINLGSNEVLESTTEQNKNPDSGWQDPILRDYKIFKRDEDAEEDTEVYLRFIAPMTTAEVNGSVTPYLTVNKVSYPVGNVIQAKKGGFDTYSTRSITAPTSVRAGEGHVDRIKDEIHGLLEKEEGYFGGPVESFAVQQLRLALRGFGQNDFNSPSEKYAKILLKGIAKKHPGLDAKEYKKIISRRRQFSDAYDKKYWFLVQLVSAELDEDGKSVPVGPPQILEVTKSAIMKAFGMYRVGDDPIVAGSLVDRCQKAAKSAKYGRAQGIPQDAGSYILNTYAGESFHDVVVTVSKGTDGRSKTSFHMDFRKEGGQAIRTELSTPLDWGRKGEAPKDKDDDRKLWGDMPDLVEYAQAQHEENHDGIGPSPVQVAIDNWKRVLGFMTQEEFDAIHGGEPEIADIDDTTADEIETSDRLGAMPEPKEVEEEESEFTEEVEEEEMMLGDVEEANPTEEDFGFTEEESAKYDELLDRGETEGWLDEDKFADVEDGRPLLEAMLSHVEPPKKKKPAGRTRTRKPAAKK